jgi:hypothetical protein
MKLLTHTRYATVASTAALVIALGGTSYAAVKITGANIADGSVTTKDVKNKSLSVKDLNPATKGKLTGAPGSPGAQGPQGATGPAGPAGKDGPSYARFAYNNTDTILTNQVGGEDPRVIAVGAIGASYLLLGKVVLTNNTNANTAFRCTLAAQSDADLATVTLPPLTSTTISLQLAHTYTGLGAFADIRCYSFGNAARAEVAKLTLIKVGDLETVNAA